MNLPLRSFIHTRPLIHALNYISCALAPPGSQTSLFGILSLPVAYFPYALIALDAMMGGSSAAAQAVSGAIVGHAWWWGVFHTRALEAVAAAPSWVKMFVADGPPPPPSANDTPAFGQPGSGVEAIRPRQRPQPAAANTGGYNWGSGNRLGVS
jgi:Derlin-2/3